jgi:hypothetical protein
VRTLDLILLLIAAVLFALAALNTGARLNLLALGLLAWVLVPLIATIRTT